MGAELFENSIPMKSRSWVWKYFSISSEDFSIAICSICKLKVTRGNKEKKSKSFNTTNMFCHINTKRKEIANKEVKLKEEEDKKKAENEQNVARCSIQSQQAGFFPLKCLKLLRGKTLGHY